MDAGKFCRICIWMTIVAETITMTASEWCKRVVFSVARCYVFLLSQFPRWRNSCLEGGTNRETRSVHSRAPTRLLLLTKHGERTTRQREQRPTVNLLAKMSQKKPFGTADSIRPICSDDDCELPRDEIDGLRHRYREWNLKKITILLIYCKLDNCR